MTRRARAGSGPMGMKFAARCGCFNLPQARVSRAEGGAEQSARVAAAASGCVQLHMPPGHGTGKDAAATLMPRHIFTHMHCNAIHHGSLWSVDELREVSSPPDCTKFCTI
jgi:hypothetical protein